MVWVRPGVLLVLAILAPTSELIRLDLPTFDRPRKAISGAPGGGNCFGSTAAVTKRVSTFMQSVTVPFRKSLAAAFTGALPAPARELVVALRFQEKPRQ